MGRSARTFFVQHILPVLVPSPCFGCEGAIREHPTRLNLCLRCRGRLKRVRPPTCRLCGAPFGARQVPDSWTCGRCRRRPSSYDRLIAVWSYEPPLDAVLRGLKFSKLHWLGAQLAREIVWTLGSDGLGDHTVVVPVPLHWRRRWARTFDQAEAIARPLAAALGIPCERAIRRHRPTAPQTGIERGNRRRNLEGAFRPARRTALPGERVLLVDDVFTTGATVESAASALRRAGPAAVTVLAAARTPSPENRA